MITRREIESERFAYATLELYHRIIDCFEGYALKEKIGELRAGYYDEIKIRTKEERDFILNLLKKEDPRVYLEVSLLHSNLQKDIKMETLQEKIIKFFKNT